MDEYSGIWQYGVSMNNDPKNEWVVLFVMQALEMAMHATAEMLMTSLSQRTLKNVTSHALAIKGNSVAARGVCKYMIPDSSEIQPQCQQRY